MDTEKKIGRHAFDRRTFLELAATAGAGAGALSLIGCAPSRPSSSAATQGSNGAAASASWRTQPDPIVEGDITQTQEADVVIIGGGLAGVSTAASALEQGLSVIMLEKNEQPRMTGLDFGCVNPTIAKEAGLELSESDIYRLIRDWTRLSANRARTDIIIKFVRNSGAALDWLCDKAVAWGCTPVLPAMKSESDTYYNYIRPVEFANGPLYDVANGSYGVNDIITMLRQEITDAGGSYLTQVKAEQLVKDGDSVTGVIASSADGTYTRYAASKGVVLCTGDFGANTEMMQDLTVLDQDNYDSLGYVNVSVGEGDGHRMGLWAGGQLQWDPQPTMVLPMTYPYFYLRVNDRGERFCNEDCDSVNMCVNQLGQHQAKAWAIWDAKWPQEIPASLQYSGGMSWDQDFRVYGDPWSEENEQAFLDSEIQMGCLVTANTIDELAEQSGIPADALKESIARYNDLASSGVDLDFGKRPELMTTIEQPPFYALRMQTMMCVTVGGLQTDTNSQVLDESGAPIDGLFAVGNTAAGLFGVDYIEAPVPGVSLGRCVTFGKLLGEYLAQ